MSSTVFNLTLNGTSYQDVFVGTSISNGTPIIVTNNTSGVVYLQEVAIQPAATSTNGIVLQPGEIRHFQKGPVDLWAFGSGTLSVSTMVNGNVAIDGAGSGTSNSNMNVGGSAVSQTNPVPVYDVYQAQKSANTAGGYFSAINTDLLTGTVNGYLDTQVNGSVGWNSAVFIYSANATQSGGTVVLEQSSDTVRWFTVYGQNISNSPSLQGSISTGASTNMYLLVPIIGRYVRARISTAPTAGGIQMVAQFSQAPFSPLPGYTSNGQTATDNVTQINNVNVLPHYGSSSFRNGLGVALMGGSPNNDRPSATLTASGNSGVIGDDFSTCGSFSIVVTAVSGTTPTLDIVLQETPDGGTTFTDVYHVPRISATGTWTIPNIILGGKRRWVYTVNGTTPSFTFSITKANNSVAPSIVRNFYERSTNILTPTTAQVQGTVFDVSGLKYLTFTAWNTASTPTTAAVLQWQFSNDLVNWVFASTITTSSAATGGVTSNYNMTTNVMARYVRLNVNTAGSGQSLAIANIYGSN